MSKHQLKAKTYKWEKKFIAQQEANKIARIAKAQAACMPGQHVLTCSLCGMMGIYPMYQQEVSHLGASNSKTHPGEISGYNY